MRRVTVEAPGDFVGALLDGRYRVDRAIGAGGFGAVYAAQHLGLGAPVALKVLTLPDGLAPDALARRVGALLEEARTLKRLHHPSIVAALDVGLLPADASGVRLPYLVMEWCGGPTLRQMLEARAGRPLPLAEAWQLFAPLLDAMTHAHAQGVAHRDLKPGNVILAVAPDGAHTPRIIDFGIAKLVYPDESPGSGATLTGSRSSPFTPRYAAPEQLAGTRTGPWTDVHALALLFVELVTGRPALGTDDDARFAVVDPVRPTPGARGIDVGALEPILLRALAVRPADRYADASALAFAMRAAAAAGFPELPVVGSPPAFPPRASASPAPSDDGTGTPSSRTLRTGSSPVTTPPVARRRRVGWVAAALAALVAIVAIGVVARVVRVGGLSDGAAPGRVIPGPPAAQRFRDVPTSEIERRVQGATLLGRCTTTATPQLVAFSCRKGLVVLMGMGLTTLKPEALRMQINNTALGYTARHGAARYAIDGTRALIVAAPPESTTAVLDALLAGDSAEVRADAEVVKPPPLSAAARAQLASWTGNDLWAAAFATGRKVVLTNLDGPNPIVEISAGSDTAMLFLVKKDARASLDDLKFPSIGAFAYALDGDTLVTVRGAPALATTEFMRALLGSAHAAEVGVYTPPR
jgi:serine/threonine protein kinase